MKMVQGAGTISNYGSYINNCQRNQYPYKIPLNTINDVQLYIEIGATKPDSIQYQLIHTCGSLSGVIENVNPSAYVVGQNSNGAWYGVFRSFDPIANPLICFVIAITLNFTGFDWIFFSDEFCIDNNCGTNLITVDGCYGNPDPKLAYDCNGIYFGIPAIIDSYLGDPTVVYKHQLLLRDIELSLFTIKNSFKQGRTRSFRTEKEKIYQFTAEFIPEWYIPEIDAAFSRGEIFINGVRYLVNETQFEKIEDCKRIWKPNVTLKESCYQSFGCEADPCADPIVESGSSGGSGESGSGQSGESSGGGGDLVDVSFRVGRDFNELVPNNPTPVQTEKVTVYYSINGGSSWLTVGSCLADMTFPYALAGTINLPSGTPIKFGVLKELNSEAVNNGLAGSSAFAQCGFSAGQDVMVLGSGQVVYIWIHWNESGVVTTC